MTKFQNMTSTFRNLKTLSWENFYSNSKFVLQAHLTADQYFLLYVPQNWSFEKSCCGSMKFLSRFCTITDSHSISEAENEPVAELAIKIQNILKKYRDCATRKIELALKQCSPTVTEDLILEVLKRHSSDWKQAYVFFNWVSKEGQTLIGSNAYNKILDILGKLRRFDDLHQVLDEMSKRGLVNEETYGVIVNRYAAAHKVEEAIEIFNKRKALGLNSDSNLVAFQKLLMCLCRYKHVEVAETMLRSAENDFPMEIKTLNIVLNGWCVLGNVCEAKRFFRDIVGSKCKPDLFTYGTFIKSLTKKGKLGNAMKIYRAMWDKECKPDVVICNCMIDALCFKKRVPEALEIFREMADRGCSPNVYTYNCLIKHMCEIGRMEKVYELLEEMVEKKGNCMPNDTTFHYLLKSLRKPEELPLLLEKMDRYGCKMNDDSYNLVLKLYAEWDCEERVRDTWNEMEKQGLGPDRRSYTVMIHWLYKKGRNEDALCYFEEMVSKGMLPEPRTRVLVDEMKRNLEKNEAKARPIKERLGKKTSRRL